MKTATTLTAIVALAGLSAGAFTQTEMSQHTPLVHETVDGKPYYLASTLLGSRLTLEDGQVQIHDLLIDEFGSLQAVIVSNPQFLQGDAAIAADLIYRAGAEGSETLRADMDSTDFQMLSQGAGYEPIGLSWATDYDNARSLRALIGEPIDLDPSSDPIRVEDVEISEGGAVMAVRFESRGWANLDPMTGRIPVNAIAFDHVEQDGWHVAATVNSAQLQALAGRETTLFLSAASAS